MESTHIAPPAHISDRDLITRVRELAVLESQATAELVAHLAELDERKLYLEEGYPSLFVYCVKVLHFSEHAAYNRIEAARAAQRFPMVLERLAEGGIHLTAVRLLRPHLTGENHQTLLRAARHRSKREVEELVARLQPKADVPTVIRRLPVRAVLAPSAPAPPAGALAGVADVEILTRPALPDPPQPAPSTQRAAVTPLAPERYRVQFTASVAALEKLRRAQELLRHQIPDGDPAAIFELALAALIERLERRKFAASSGRPRSEPAQPAAAESPERDSGGEGGGAITPGRHIPAHVRRHVWARDGGRCTFVSADRRQCAERGWIEFHHRQPYARGGTAMADNIELRCRGHNAHESELHFRPWKSLRQGGSTGP